MICPSERLRSAGTGGTSDGLTVRQRPYANKAPPTLWLLQLSRHRLHASVPKISREWATIESLVYRLINAGTSMILTAVRHRVSLSKSLAVMTIEPRVVTSNQLLCQSWSASRPRSANQLLNSDPGSANPWCPLRSADRASADGRTPM